MRIIFHIDVNSAYLSWTAVEQLKNGAKVDIRTIPAIIGGDQKSRHGIVLAKSIPAKKYGIQTGEPVAMALRKCPDLVIVKSDFELYIKSEKLSAGSPDVPRIQPETYGFPAYLHDTYRTGQCG